MQLREAAHLCFGAASSSGLECEGRIGGSLKQSYVLAPQSSTMSSPSVESAQLSDAAFELQATQLYGFAVAGYCACVAFVTLLMPNIITSHFVQRAVVGSTSSTPASLLPTLFSYALLTLAAFVVLQVLRHDS